MESSKIPLDKWLVAIRQMTAAPTSALSLSRKLDIEYKSALFMTHRIRHAMSGGGLARLDPASPTDKGNGGSIYHAISSGRRALYNAEEAFRSSGSRLSLSGRISHFPINLVERTDEWKSLAEARSLLKACRQFLKSGASSSPNAASVPPPNSAT